jgi:hypothetical protein
MSVRGELPGLVALRRPWRRWAEVVESFALRRPGRGRLREREYEALHRLPLQTCRSLADAAGEVRRGYYQGLEDLVRPWLTPRTLEQADGEILLALLARCRQVGRELGGSGWGPVARRAARRGLAAAAVAGLYVVLSRADWLTRPAAECVREVCRQFRWAVRQSNEVERWLASGCVAVLVAMLVVWRSARG